MKFTLNQFYGKTQVFMANFGFILHQNFIQKLLTSYSMKRDPFNNKTKRMIMLIEVTNTHLFSKVENIARIFKMY